MKKRLLQILSISVLTIFVGCGGGGGGDSSISQTSKEYPPATLTGMTERDYIIKNAKVIIKSPKGDYEVETFTDEEGKYQAKIDKFLQPLSINLICTKDSKIVKKDSQEECEEGFTLKSLTPPLYPDRKETANITLLSDLTYYIANELGGITKDNVEDAIAIISQVFGGVNPIQSDPSKGKYYDVLRSLHASGMDKEENKIAFARALSDGYIDPNDPNEKDLLSIVSSNLKRNFQANLITKAVSKNRVITIITPTKKEEDPKIEAAKDMLRDMREEVLSIKNYKDPNNPSVYDKELKNFNQISKNNVFPHISYIGSFIQRVTEMIKRSEEENLPKIEEEFQREEKSKENLILTLRKEIEEPKNYESWDYMITGGDQNYSGTFTYIAKDESSPSFKNAKAYSFFGSLPLADKSLLKKGVKDIENFKGKAVRFDNNETSYYLILSAKMSTQKDGNESIYQIKDSKYLILTKDKVEEDISSIKIVRPQFAVTYISIPNYEIKGIFKFSDFQQNRTYKKNKGEAPAIIKFHGSFRAKLTKSRFDGDLQLKIKNFQDANLSQKHSLLYESKVAGEFHLPQHDPILLTAYSDEIEKNRYYTEVSYTFGAKTIFASGNIFKKDYFSWDLMIRNQEAVAMHVIGNERGEFGGEATVNNEKVGSFEKLNDLPIIRFTDGTFESIP